MVHILASAAFTLVALGSFGLIVSLLMQEQAKILAALGVQREALRQEPRHPVRVRAVGRRQMATAQSPRSTRAAA